MKKYRFLTAFLSLLVLLGALCLPALAGETEQTGTEPSWANDLTGYRENLVSGAPEYEAGCETALLLEMNSGIVVYAKNAETTVYPASLTKIMTCMVTLEYAGKDLDKYVTVSETALEGIAEAGGEVRLKVDERLPLRDLLYYLMVSSTNEAGNVIAEYVAGDISSFVSLMNKTARDLGCTGTHFNNTHGLHDPNHYTTARDLSVITRKALTYELFREICNTAEYTVPATNLSSSRKLTTTNFLILKDGNRYLADNGNYFSYYLEEAQGVKTGYTSAAGRCVISRATDGNLDLLCIIMGARTRTMSDGSTRYDNFVEAKKLFNYGFTNFAYAKVAAQGTWPMFQVEVEYGQDRRGVVLIPSQDVSCLLPKEYDKDKVTTRYELDDPKGLVAPMDQGQQVGTLYVSYEGVVVGSTRLETLTAVEERPVDKAIADFTGKDKTEAEKSFFQKLLGYWYVPLLVILALILLLALRNAIYRYRSRKALERRRKRAILRDMKAAQAMPASQRGSDRGRTRPARRADLDQPTRRINLDDKGGRR